MVQITNHESNKAKDRSVVTQKKKEPSSNHPTSIKKCTLHAPSISKCFLPISYSKIHDNKSSSNYVIKLSIILP